MNTLKKLLATVALIGALAAPASAHSLPDYCAVVKKTSDGFLALRKKPSAKSEMIAAMKTGFPLHVTGEAQWIDGDMVPLYPNWTKWTYVSAPPSEDADPTHGWVYSKYLKKVPCEGPAFSRWRD